MKLTKLLIYSTGLISGIGVAVAVVSSAGSNSSVIPYSFQDGQVISADTMNSLFTQVQNVVQGFQSEAELNGAWNCTTYDTHSSIGAPGFPSGNFQVDNTTGLYALNQTWTFTQNGTLLTISNNTAPGGIQGVNITGGCNGVSSLTYGSHVIQSALLLAAQTSCISGNNVAMSLVKNSPYQFHAVYGSTFLSCVAVNQPPNAPSGLTTSISNGGGVTLTWTDNGGSPTGFIILKRVNGSYTQIGTVGVITSYTDSTGVTGDLYRVESTNNNGNSLPSAAALAG